jgi:hypothetical protein
MTPEERAVINAAITWRNELGLRGIFSSVGPDGPLHAAVDALIYSCPQCNTETHICPGCGENVGHGEGACDRCERESLPYDVPDELLWAARTLVDVRAGDRIRLAGVEAYVVTLDRSDWHMREGAGGHWDDVPHEHTLIRARLDYPGSDPERIMEFHDPTLAIDIQLTRGELDAIELFGWENRVQMANRARRLTS